MVKNLERKTDIRNRTKAKRKLLPVQARTEYSRKITSYVLGHPFFCDAPEIYCYASWKEEVSTAELIRTSLKLGKKVALPKVLDGNTMLFYYINTPSELIPGYQGILEPAADVQRIADNPAALMIVPGLVFDKSGNRIGYGKGFYDAYLACHPEIKRIGLAFSIQCTESVPADPHDIRMDEVITEKGCYMSC